MEENFLFASFSSFLNKKQTLREMYLSSYVSCVIHSHIDKKEIKPPKRKQKHRRGHSVASKVNPDLGNQDGNYKSSLQLKKITLTRLKRISKYATQAVIMIPRLNISCKVRHS